MTVLLSADVSLWVWLVTLGVILGLLAFDFFFHVRQAHEPTLKEATWWSIFYVGLALLFGVVLLVFGGADMGVEYFSGYLLEKALSVDNLFVFLVIISSFAVPRADQQKVLLFGIVFALIARSGFIFAGKALIDNFSWTFYLFGLILLLMHGRIDPATRMGKAYLVFMFIGAISAIFVIKTPPGAAVAALSLISLTVGATIGFVKPLARYRWSIETIALSVSYFTLLLPSVTETLTRLPAGDPVASGVEDPLVVSFQLTLLVLLTLGVTLQLLSRRRRLSSAALA